jgi:hypothetical protein
MLLILIVIGSVLLTTLIVSLGKLAIKHENVSKSQIEWVLRRDGSHCCFIYLDEGHNLGICGKNSKHVYRIFSSNFLTRIIYDTIVIPNRLVSLCDVHYELIIRSYNPKYEKKLAEVSDIYTRFYKFHYPEDEFPI